MLTDVALKVLKPREKIYKVADRDGMYVRVTPVARSRFSWITDSTDGGRRSIWASMDTMESRLPGPERNASMRGALFAKDDRPR
jgi:hypothetical protein